MWCVFILIFHLQTFKGDDDDDGPDTDTPQPMFSDAFQWHIPTPPVGDYITVIVDLLRPLSRDGYVKLRSTDPLEQPEINLRFFSNDLDLIAMREGVRKIDDIITKGEGMKDIIEEDYPWPMPRNSDEAMKKVILERSQTGFRKSLLTLSSRYCYIWAGDG